MRIPEIADRVREIAEQIQGDHPIESGELLELADEMRRRPSGPKAPASSTPMTRELALEIREYAEEHSGLSQQTIAEAFNVNHGRVSEAIKGKRV
jgi:hypothetical protein